MSHFVKFNVSCTVKGIARSANEECLIDSGDFKTLTRMKRMGVSYVEELNFADAPETKERLAQAKLRTEETRSAVREEVIEEVRKELREEVRKEVRDEIYDELRKEFLKDLADLADTGKGKNGKKGVKTATKKKGEEA